ncbi:CbiQ family ECF transporter T component [Candidatus Synechococcus calcipolaris G9]|uniref:CbiQ family ECF transporter T component n=1 Tax=Candidatus Synechococcus calcipolaris G9 TaxID=1497997 RepID=A0ABT6F0B9_9SYNE|nr:CbiQ family ECF transporter T component [Candidatus Synechococcus calcipolaris]MDG2991265.1 CbiQ family ECF transporter T component [Candidatus Synechococcus calcipolaris G9]
MDLLRSLPLGLYLEHPITWLHRLDARVKMAWLMSFLLTPLLADGVWRVLLVLFLMILTGIGGIPARVWRRQMVWLLILASLILGMTALMPDGLAIAYQPRRPLELEIPATDYNYILWQFQSQVLWQEVHLQITRRSLDLGVRLSTLLFTLIYSTHLYLLTTAPEEITAALANLMHPLRRFRWPVTELALTLTLSLRFIPLVLEEVQNLIRSLRTRAINWRKIGFRGAINIWMMLAVRLLENLLLRAEQVACAMQVRGFTTSGEYESRWHRFRFLARDWWALFLIIPFWLLRVILPRWFTLG